LPPVISYVTCTTVINMHGLPLIHALPYRKMAAIFNVSGLKFSKPDVGYDL